MSKADDSGRLAMSKAEDIGPLAMPGPSLTNNRLLIALAQNGALRLRCERAFVSLQDGTTQHMVAEATPSTLLCDAQDPASLGLHALAKDHATSSRSIAVFTDCNGAEARNTEDAVADTTRLAVKDMRLLDQYNKCGHVVGPPYMVSFAEVPIRSASGQVLGTYTVMDNQPRVDFLDQETTCILLDIAATITSFLELQGYSTSSSAWTADSVAEQAHPEPGCSSASSLPERSFPGLTESSSTVTLLTPQSEISEFSFSSHHTKSTSTVDREFPDLSTSASQYVDTRESSHVFSEAAQKICSALDFEGFVFLDRPVNAESAASLSACEILGSFNTSEDCAAGLDSSLLSLHGPSLDYLAQTYPRGCAFVANDQGIVISGDCDVSTVQSGPSQSTDITPDLSSDLQSLFREARSVIFIPLWLSSHQRLYAGMLGWSREPARIFSNRDVACLSVFGRSFMLEVGRLEAMDMEGIKSDFVSSVSHELRSPLHGCLAAVEFLQETTVDDTQAELIEMIQACASTLLDTLNHLLDFSKITELKSAKSRVRRDVKSLRLSHSQNTFGSTTQSYLCTILQDVIEGVHFGRSSQLAAYSKASASPINNLAFSTNPAILLDCANDADPGLFTEASDAVAVYLEVENHSHWCTTLPAGAWKRLLMNVFANALKFTVKGYVEVSMKLLEDEGQGNKRVHLKVQDTGIGMSEEYMKMHLYQPFAQENQLASGVGLGLSIVKQIVDDLEGTIIVQSTPGVGTRFDIFVPLCEQDSQCQGPLPSGGEILDPNADLKGLTLCLISPSDHSTCQSDAHSKRISVMHSYVRSIAEGWFGMKIVTAQTTTQIEADIYIAEALHFVEDADTKRRPTILVGPSPAAKASDHASRNNITRLAYPLGPRTLGRALFAALKQRAEPEQPHEVLPERPETSEAHQENLINVFGREFVSQQEDIASSKPEVGKTKDAVNSEHVLLVDDNAINLKLLAAYVKKLGVSAESAVDGEDAFQKYQVASQSKPFTTILMDISMPKMNGFESTRAIRGYETKHSMSPPARIIALTGLGSETSKREAELSGMDDFRTKPVALKTLKDLLSARERPLI